MTDDFNKLKVEYDSQSIMAGQFSTEVVRQIEALISQKNIRLGFPIQSRVKTWSSIEEKVARIGLKLMSLSSLQDLVGLRITLTFLRDVEKVKSIIEETFDVTKTYDTSARLSSNQFGYSSIHMLIKCPKSWESVPSLSHLVSFQAEVQIRTLAQHIWAEVSHQLQYKNEENVPHEVLRSISRSSALLETVDLEFERVLDGREEYKSEIKRAHTLNDMPINSDNLDVLFEELMPVENRQDGDRYSYLINDCKQLGIAKIFELRTIIETHKDAMLREEKSQVKTKLDDLEKGRTEHLGTDIERLKRGVFYTYVGLTRQALSEEFGEDRMREIINNSQS